MSESTSGIPWRSRTTEEERGCLNQGLKNNWTLWTKPHLIALLHLLPLLLSGDLCYNIFACRLPEWTYSCAKQINLPCYYNCIHCVYGESFFPAKHVVFQRCCVETQTKLSQKYMEINIFRPPFPDSLLLLGLPSVSDPVLDWILILWVLPHHSPPQLWAPCTEHDVFLCKNFSR